MEFDPIIALILLAIILVYLVLSRKGHIQITFQGPHDDNPELAKPEEPKDSDGSKTDDGQEDSQLKERPQGKDDKQCGNDSARHEKTILTIAKRRIQPWTANHPIAQHRLTQK